MYNDFFGFTEKPFEVTPDPKFLYLTRAYQEILSALVYGICERRGFIAIVGEVGTGKTMMINALLDRLEHETKVAFIFNSDLTFRQMLTMALCDLGLAAADENLSKIESIQRLNDFAISQLEKNGNVVIIVDEAQSLSHKTMENLRMLSNLETRKHKLVQMILSGQPELDAKLNRPEWRQLVQRISLKRYSTNLGEEDTYGYIQHRLNVAGFEESHLFSQKALQMIWEYSQGIPRKINILCDNALLIAYGIEQKKISQEIIQEAINDLSWSPFLDKPRSQTSLAGNTHAFSLEQEEQAAQKQRLSNSEGTPPIASDEIQTPSFKESANNKAEEINTPDPGEIPEPISVDFQAPKSEDPFLPVSTEIRHSHEFDVSEEVSRKMFNRIRLSFIAGILLLLCLIIGAWLFFTQSISSSDQNLFSRLEIVQTEARALLSDSLDSNTGKVEPLIIEHPRASLREDSEEILR